ncbi:ABC transporter ATP-binding protein [Pontibacillus litoralis]|uniref:ABC transporter ATP-binding protein n=1 Tax=Pontibacillus litoralis JSM 072002 TaxID=1385512 RepID=A0A0A5FV82_9BACI|nr:ABC transporter ATP-binding protein [Pontibacillus litoralis]KGX84696.1 ABC transporter ATP-binding protein [Pontibacillus litoralis JSM 072002]
MIEIKGDNKDLIINAVSKSYKRGTVRANCDISVALHPGQIVAIIGHNGAGKSTLLNQIIGIVKPDQGQIDYNGISFIDNTKYARSLVSMMPQLYAPLAGVTLRQSIESILHIRGISGKKNKELCKEILDELKIEKWADRPGEKLSGGLQRLASFAMAVVYPSPILLLDEPTNDVDPVRRKLIWNYMRKLARNGHILVVVTHNLLEVEQYADRFLLLNHGKLIQDELTVGEHKQISSNTLFVVMNDWDALSNLPESLETRYIEEEMQVIFNLSAEQVPDAIAWVLKQIHERKVVNYRLTSATLEASYGGLTDGNE